MTSSFLPNSICVESGALFILKRTSNKTLADQQTTRRYCGVIFDFDGTLADTEPLYYRANRDAFKQFGHLINEDEYYHCWSLMGYGSKGEIERYSLHHIDPDKVKTLARDNYRRLVQEETPPLMPYAKEILTNLCQTGFKVVIASNTRRDLISHILRNTEFNDSRVHIIGGDMYAPKPAPDIFLAAVDYLGIDKRQCLILEDTDKGVRAARAAGIDFAVIHSPLYADFHPDDAIGKFSSLKSFYAFLTG